MRVVPLNNKVFCLEVVNISDVAREPQPGESARCALELDLERVDVIAVDMRVAELYDEG